MRIAAAIEYRGTCYSGWQRQKNDTIDSVQAAVETAFSHVANESIEVICAGRTDAGVHARGQVIHFDTQAERSEYAWQAGVNSALSRDIAVRWIKFVDNDFHARFSALSRRYEYIIYNHRTRPAIMADYVTHYYESLDIDAMIAASQFLIGEHDFSSFRGGDCQAKSPIRDIHGIEITQHGSFIKIDIRANAFLHHMVRNIVGTLLHIGSGKEQAIWMEEVLAAKDRKVAAMTAPSNGLYLMEVEYPTQFDLPAIEDLHIFTWRSI